MNEHQELNDEYNKTYTDLENTQKQLEVTTESLIDSDKEIATLQECIQKLSEVNGEEKSVQLERVEAMLDTTRVQTELRAVTNERDQLQLDIQSQTSFLDQLQNENECLQQQIVDTMSAKESILQQYQETQMKLKAITEYFEEKENNLHRKIGEEEMVRQRVESREAYAKERADLAEQEREKEK